MDHSMSEPVGNYVNRYTDYYWNISKIVLYKVGVGTCKLQLHFTMRFWKINNWSFFPVKGSVNVFWCETYVKSPCLKCPPLKGFFWGAIRSASRSKNVLRQKNIKVNSSPNWVVLELYFSCAYHDFQILHIFVVIHQVHSKGS